MGLDCVGYRLLLRWVIHEFDYELFPGTVGSLRRASVAATGRFM
jgi:hypothetical protein